MPSLTFLPEHRTNVLDEPVDLALAASRCDIWLEHPCGARTVCGKCRVRVVRGEAAETPADRRLLGDDERADGWRLACQFVVARDCEIEIPSATRAVAPKSFGAATLAPGTFRPEITRVVVPSPRPEGAHAESLLDTLGRSMGRRGLRAPQDVLSALTSLSAAHDRLAVVSRGRDLLHIEPPASHAPVLGVAVDLGSTSLAAALVDLTDARVVGSASALNPQVRHGADVISRIHFAQEHADGGARLHAALVGAVGELIDTLLRAAGAPRERVFAVTCAGNATMTHSAVGAPIAPLGEAPYVGVFTREWDVPAMELGWPAHPAARARFLPMIGRHVGGDTVAAAIACGVDRAPGWRLLVDLGTNAEVLLGCRDRLVVTSTAAGPAFEGATISCGMRAAPGAIDAVRVLSDGRLVCGTIASQPAAGLCGSGLVDAVAELLRAGVIAPSGYMRSAAECNEQGVPPLLTDRIVETPQGGRAVRLARDVVLTAQDVRQLQLVKGSTAAGIALLLDHLALTPGDLEDVSIAGTFGSFLRKASVLAIGLVPAVDPERVHFVGNAAGAGARLALVDAVARRRAIRLAGRAEYVELADHPGYEDAFCRAIPFPKIGELGS